MRTPMPDARQSGLAALISLLAFFALSGCPLTPITAKDPEIIFATQDEISIGAWGWTRPDHIASEHCRRFDKEAVFLATVRADEYDDRRIVYYSCRWPNYGSAAEPYELAALTAEFPKSPF
jgi:hypothetical protein